MPKCTEFQGYAFAFAYEIDLGSGNKPSSLKLRSGDRLFSHFVTLRRPTHLLCGRRGEIPRASPRISPPCGQRQQLFINLLNQLAAVFSVRSLYSSLLFFLLELRSILADKRHNKNIQGGEVREGGASGPGIPGTLSAAR